MFSISSGSTVQFCDRVSRRAALEVGGMSALGLTLPLLLSGRSSASQSAEVGDRGPTFGRAKRMILLFMWGGPAHQDVWDLKPNGPEASRGEFLPIATNVPGLDLCEHLPLLSRHGDKLALIRSVGQEDNNHSTGAHAGLTGRRHELAAENFGARETDFPHFGSVLHHLRPSPKGLPTAVSLPDIITTTSGPQVPGQVGGFLGKSHDPFQITDHPDRFDFSVSSLTPGGGLSLPRMMHRRELLTQLDQTARVVDRSAGIQAMDGLYHQALDMVLSPTAREAFDLSRVAQAERMRYGWHTFGQSLLLARRLIEAGVQLVTVYWHVERKGVDSTWDTHSNNFVELKNRLLPSVDRPMAALLDDLSSRGLLDETLIVWNSEFGRSPNVNGAGGRDHWGPCNTVVMAGGGVPGGQVYGASDQKAAYPTAEKVTQNEIAATIYHQLGFDPETLIYDRLHRPFPIALGQPIHKLLGGQALPVVSSGPRPVTRVLDWGPFHRFLRERARRFIVASLGFTDSEKIWELSGFAPATGTGWSRSRLIAGPQPGRIKLTGHFYNGGFAYDHLVVRLTEPRPLAELKLTISGTPITLPADLLSQSSQTLWQIPLPEGFTSGLHEVTIDIQADRWPVADIALLAQPITAPHLELIGTTV